MIAALSPETYLFIVGGFFFLCTVCFLLLALAAVMNPRRRAREEALNSKPLTLEEIDRFRAELDAVREPVKAIGRVPAEDRRAA